VRGQPSSKHWAAATAGQPWWRRRWVVVAVLVAAGIGVLLGWALGPAARPAASAGDPGPVLVVAGEVGRWLSVL
jgi:hypothetical protein